MGQGQPPSLRPTLSDFPSAGPRPSSNPEPHPQDAVMGQVEVLAGRIDDDTAKPAHKRMTIKGSSLALQAAQEHHEARNSLVTRVISSQDRHASKLKRSQQIGVLVVLTAIATAVFTGTAVIYTRPIGITHLGGHSELTDQTYHPPGRALGAHRPDGRARRGGLQNDRRAPRKPARAARL